MPGTRKLGRATSHRTAMLRAMVTFLLENGKIETKREFLRIEKGPCTKCRAPFSYDYGSIRSAR